MKANIYSRIPIIIGILNWILVIVIILGLRYAGTGEPIEEILINGLTLGYLRLSFISAIISIGLASIVGPSSKTSSAVNYTLNILYLVFYILVFLIPRI